jgi:carbon starvation protein
LVPLVWLLAVTMTAGVQKIFDANPKIGFLSAASALEQKMPELQKAIETSKLSGDAALIKEAEKALKSNHTIHFNFLLDAVVTGIFLTMVLLIVAFSLREWILLLARKRLATLHETEPVWLPDYAVAEARPLHVVSVIALTFALVKELSGQSAVERAQVVAVNSCCESEDCHLGENKKSLEKIYVQETERRFGKNVNRCC